MIWIWAGFLVFVLLMLALDLGVFHRHAHVVSMREALGWSAVWVGLGLTFAVFVYLGYEHHWMGLGLLADGVDGQVNDGYAATVKYLTGYVIEKSLSVDNVFVIAMIFSFMAVPRIHQHRVLFWGILGALALRGAMIVVGAELIARYHWILYLFGAFLLVTAVKMLLVRGHGDPSQTLVVRWTKRLVPITDRLHGQRLVVRDGSGVLMLTPLALALILVETTDVIFAVDSIPAIFAITADPFLVFTSNAFAILGLRSLYFALSEMVEKFRYLKVSLAAVLGIVGLKMIFASPLKAALGPGFNLYLLAVVLAVLAGGILASWWHPAAASSGTLGDDAIPPGRSVVGTRDAALRSEH